MQHLSNIIPLSELDDVTGGRTKEPSPSGTLDLGGGAGGRALSKKERAHWERYCNGAHPDDDPFGIAARERRKTCEKQLGH